MHLLHSFGKGVGEKAAETGYRLLRLPGRPEMRETIVAPFLARSCVLHSVAHATPLHPVILSTAVTTR